MELGFFSLQGLNSEAKFQQQEQTRISPGKALQTIEQYQKDSTNSSKKEVLGVWKNQRTILPLPYRTTAKLPTLSL